MFCKQGSKQSEYLLEDRLHRGRPRNDVDPFPIGLESFASKSIMRIHTLQNLWLLEKVAMPAVEMATPLTLPDRHLEIERPVGPDRPVVDGSHPIEIRPVVRHLIGQAREDIPVADDVHTFFESGQNLVLKVIDAIGRKKECQGGAPEFCRIAPGRGRDDPLPEHQADQRARRAPGGLGGDDGLFSQLTDVIAQETRLGRRARSIESFEDDKESGTSLLRHGSALSAA